MLDDIRDVQALTTLFLTTAFIGAVFAQGFGLNVEPDKISPFLGLALGWYFRSKLNGNGAESSKLVLPGQEGKQ